MTTKQLVLREIDRLEEPDLKKLYEIVKRLVQGKKKAKKLHIFEALAKVTIDGPKDFAENHDAYLNGEKNVKTTIR